MHLDRANNEWLEGGHVKLYFSLLWTSVEEKEQSGILARKKVVPKECIEGNWAIALKAETPLALPEYTDNTCSLESISEIHVAVFWCAEIQKSWRVGLKSFLLWTCHSGILRKEGETLIDSSTSFLTYSQNYWFPTSLYHNMICTV